MWLDFVCAENVQHFHPARFKVIRDKRAMATPPDCFCAHDCDRTRSDGFPAVMFYFGGCPSRRSLTCNVEQSLDPSLELLRLHVIGRAAKRRVAPRSVARIWLGFSFAAQLRKMFVTDSVRVQRFRQRVLVELRITLGARPRAHVSKELDLVFLQQRNEFIDHPRRVPDGPDSHDSSKRRRLILSWQAIRTVFPGIFANVDCRAGAAARTGVTRPTNERQRTRIRRAGSPQLARRGVHAAQFDRESDILSLQL